MCTAGATAIVWVLAQAASVVGAAGAAQSAAGGAQFAVGGAEPAAGAADQAALPAPERLLPASTAAVVIVPDTDNLEKNWQQTQLGQLAADPVMKPFAEDLQRQFEARWTTLRERLGLGLEDLRELRGRSLAVAFVRPQGVPVSQVVLLDVRGQEQAAAALLQKASQQQLARGAKRREQAVAGVNVTVFDLAPQPQGAGPQRVAFFMDQGLLGAADSLEAIEDLLHRWRVGGSESLADVPGFQAVMRRCQQDAGASARPQVRWFVHPLSYAQVIHALTPPEKRRKGRSIATLMENQGLGAVQGLGGFVDFAAEGFERVHRTAIYAPPPRPKGLKMAALPNGAIVAPPAWVPRDVASYAMFYVDLAQAFDNFGPLFDDLYGQGEEGVWEQVLEGLRTDPNGPQIDLREELIVHLGPRVIMLSDYTLPITPTSERLLFAVEGRDPEAVAAAVAKTMRTDQSVRRREISGHVIWETVEPPPVAVPAVEVRPSPALPFEQPPRGERKPQPKKKQLMPRAAVTVAYGHLIVASHIEFLLEVLEPRAERETLARDLEYREVAAALEGFGLGACCGLRFARTDEENHVAYELLRQNKLPEAETLLGWGLNRLLGAAEVGTTRAAQLDGRKLPQFDVVRRYLGPAGLLVRSEPDGWFIKGVLLTKQ